MLIFVFRVYVLKNPLEKERLLTSNWKSRSTIPHTSFRPFGTIFWISQWKYSFAVVDAFTKFTWLEAVRNTSSEPVITCLILLMKFFGNLVRMITDRGKGFTSKVMQDFCKTKNIKHILNTQSLDCFFKNHQSFNKIYNILT